MAGRLVVNTGSMFSGKSTELLRQGERHKLAGKKVIYLKPAVDNRYQAGKIYTHSGQSYDAIKISTEESLLTVEILEADVVLIDEIQFFKERVIREINILIDLNIDVYVSGLDIDANGEPWQTTMYLMAIADKVQKFQAVCKKCGADAYISAKKTKVIKENIIDIGGHKKYMPLCRECYNAFRKLEEIENV